ncbi:DUF5688 family protein [Blautia massiliensis (ex Durand et al. 2017)]|uniref:DUF5688 family protein n=1 Tax=Blautia massiliensis (ex Durand et al. 2017) TaxID=1737424 RepID=UPI0035672AC4
MNFNEFVNEVKDNIKLFLPKDYENAEVSTMECQKLNRAYTGLMVRKEGEMLTPTINLNQLYEAYKAQPGVTMETVCRKIADIVIEAPIQVDLKAILNYEDVKDKLFIRVSSAEANKEVLENAPHQLKEDLAITYHVAVGKDQDGLSSMFIKNDLLEQYGISAEQLHEDAMKSSPRVMAPEVSSIGALIDEMYQKNILMLTPDEREMLQETLQESSEMPTFFVVTNTDRIDGAGVIFYPEFMDSMGELLGNDFFILPSSIHEMLVLPDDGQVDISERVDRAMYPFKYDYTLEEEMFRGNGDRYAIYHVDEDTPGKQHLFMNMAMVKEDGITIDAANYKCVYSGRLHENEKLDDLYAMFNDNPPADYKAHSMSVSDVIITNRGGDMQAYYVDRFGFAELPDFAAQREKILDIVPEIENVDYENDLTCISFYAAECAEFPVMGEVHYDLTLPEALEAYEKIPSERMHGLKCVGFDLKDGSDYEGMQSLMIEGKIQKEFLNSIPGFRENSYVQNAISRVEKYLEEKHPNVENPLKSNKKVDNEKNISEEKNEKELNIQMKPIPKKKRGEMSL